MVRTMNLEYFVLYNISLEVTNFPYCSSCVHRRRARRAVTQGQISQPRVFGTLGD
jgi:hypothetical protein